MAQKLGQEAAKSVDWTNPRIICVAAAFSRYDLHAVREIGRRIDLVRYVRFGDGLLALDLVASTAGSGMRAARTGTVLAPTARSTVSQRLGGAPAAVQELYADLDGRLLDFGDVHSVELLHYIAYRRGGNFVTVNVLSGGLRLFLRVDPTSVELEAGFTRDVSEIGHHGTGDLEVRISSMDDLDRALPLLQASYEAAS
ncbi:DUF5655 domain-containing protein [Kitasatospora sp. NPDC091335]|uniref:DUF5655 domain-containing protein n=1 Tax=Kitasatospora sp. NPDC091335 TaxID=3364085 RepID=UPI0038180636